MKEIFSHRLKGARKALGLSMEKLAEQIGVSKQMISKYEKGESLPDSRHLLLLSQVLHKEPDYFFRPIKIDVENIRFRKKSKVKGRILAQLQEQIIDKIEKYQEIEEILGIENKFANPLENIIIDSEEHVEQAAEYLRQQWKLWDNPIFSVTELLEKRGIKVLEIETDEHFDGLCAIIDDSAVIVVEKTENVERKRFTLLHELGHLLFNYIQDRKKSEKLANRFAGAMLLPQQAIIDNIGFKPKEIDSLSLEFLQKNYGISKPAIFYRLKDLQIITQSLFIAINKRKNFDPGFKIWLESSIYPVDESTDRFERLVYKALAQDLITYSKASDLLNISIEEIYR